MLRPSAPILLCIAFPACTTRFETPGPEPDTDPNPAWQAVLEEAYAAADKVGDPEQRKLVLAKVSRAIDRLK